MRSNQSENAERENLDTQIRAAMHRVDVPMELADRIKLAVRAEMRSELVQVAPSGSVVGLARQDGGSLPARPTGSLPARHRRWFLGAAAAASLIGIGATYRFLTRPTEQSRLADYCSARLERLRGSAGQGNALTQGSALTKEQNLRLQDVLQQVQHIKSLHFIGDLSADGFAKQAWLYRLDAWDGKNLYLFELNLGRIVANLSTNFDALSTNSGGWSLAGMQRRHWVFVLAGRYKESQLLDFVRPSVIV